MRSAAGRVKASEALCWRWTICYTAGRAHGHDPRTPTRRPTWLRHEVPGARDPESERDRADRGHRLGDDPEDLHKYRVATRRSRALIRATRPLLGERLVAGNRVAGPAIIQVPDTTIVVHPGQAARIDAYGNVLVDLTAP